MTKFKDFMDDEFHSNTNTEKLQKEENGYDLWINDLTHTQIYEYWKLFEQKFGPKTIGSDLYNLL